MQKLQVEHAEWLNKKYPNQPPEMPAAGCLEEAGELLHAILKMQQVQIWGEDNRYKLVTLRTNLIDAIGDCGIYACSLCNACNWNFELVWTLAEQSLVSSDPLKSATELIVAASRVAMNPYDVDLLVEFVKQLKLIAHNYGLDAEIATRVAWETVKCR